MERRRRLAATLGLVALVIVDIALVFAALRITGGRSSAAETPSGPTERSRRLRRAPSRSPPPPRRRRRRRPPRRRRPHERPRGAAHRRAERGRRQPRLAGDGRQLRLGRRRGPDHHRRRQDLAQPHQPLPGDHPDPGHRRDQGVRRRRGRARARWASARRPTAAATWPGTGSLADTLARDAKDPTKVRAPGTAPSRPAGPSGRRPRAQLGNGAPRSSAPTGRSARPTDDGAHLAGGRQGDLGAGPGQQAGRQHGHRLRRVDQAGLRGRPGQHRRGRQGRRPRVCRRPPTSAPGKVALAVSGPQTGWMVVGGTTWRSSDGLKTWSKA